jgi:hypothetical protein
MIAGSSIGWRRIFWRLRAIATWNGSRGTSRLTRKISAGGWGRIRLSRIGLSIARWLGKRWLGKLMKEARFFFFVKKKQKTFANLAYALPRRVGLMDKSFLLLFYKKEESSFCVASIKA